MARDKLTNEEVVDILLQHDLDYLDYVKSERCFYLYKKNHLEFLDPDFEFPEFLHRSLKNLKQQGTLPPSFNITSALVTSLTEQIAWSTPHKHASIDSNFLAFSDDMLLDTSSHVFKLVKADRNIPAFIHFPYPSSILLNDTPPKRFLEFLDETLQDPELTFFVQQMMGYCLLDSIAAHAVFFLYGSGQNGKSVLLHVIESMLPPSLISANSLKDLTMNPFRLSSLVGKRLNIAGEEESKHLESGMFKQISAGDTVRAERKFQGSFDFTPKVKLIFGTNRIPTFDSVDIATRRRLFIIPFKHTIPDHKRDPFLKTTLVQEEMPQILAWALQGAKYLIEHKYQFTRPKAIEDACKQQELNTSSALQFFNEQFIMTKNPDDIFPRSHMYTLYGYWCIDEKKHPFSRQRFFQELEQRYKDEGLGFPTEKIKDPATNTRARVIQGVIINPDADTSYSPIALKAGL